MLKQETKYLKVRGNDGQTIYDIYHHCGMYPMINIIDLTNNNIVLLQTVYKKPGHLQLGIYSHTGSFLQTREYKINLIATDTTKTQELLIKVQHKVINMFHDFWINLLGIIKKSAH